MARAALIALAVYIIQHTLLPAATFKETMRDDDLGYTRTALILRIIF